MIQNKFNRRRFLSTLGVFSIGTAATGAYGKTVGAERLEIGAHQVFVSKKIPATPLKVLHLSDLHASDMVGLEFLERAVDLGLSERPDLICLTGDYITRQYDQWDDYAKVLSKLSDFAPTYATLGNHDGGSWSGQHIKSYDDSTLVRKLLEKSQIKLLDNESKTVALRGWKLNLVGLGDLWTKDFDPKKAFTDFQPEKDSSTIVLSHNPDTKDPLQTYPWDLMLSGHTHGGQIRFPLIGAPVSPVKDKRFVKGLHRWDDRWVYVTKGVGNLYGVRINCRPEVSLLTLV